MGKNSMTDVLNLRRLASELRKEKHARVPSVKVVLKLSKKLGILTWAKDTIYACGWSCFEEMIDYYLSETAEPSA